MKGISGIAPPAAQGATGQAHEHRRPTLASGFPLNGQKDFGDAKGDHATADPRAAFGRGARSPTRRPAYQENAESRR